MDAFKKLLWILLGMLSIGIIVYMGVFIVHNKLCSTDVIHTYPAPSGIVSIKLKVISCEAGKEYYTAMDLGSSATEFISIHGDHRGEIAFTWIDDAHAIVNYVGDNHLINNYRDEVSGISMQFKNGQTELEIPCANNSCK